MVEGRQIYGRSVTGRERLTKYTRSDSGRQHSMTIRDRSLNGNLLLRVLSLSRGREDPGNEVVKTQELPKIFDCDGLRSLWPLCSNYVCLIEIN